MKSRTFDILIALIKEFVESGSPVSSSRLLGASKLSISSATIRNEFSLLENAGLILSPHVSSGKVPTQKGYRYFVDETVKKKNQPKASYNQKIITELFLKYKKNYQFAKQKEVLFDVLKLISELSKNVAFLTIDNDRTFYLGISNFLRIPEYATQPQKVAEIIEIFEGQERFRNFLGSLELQEDVPKIFIGEENLLQEISSCSMIISKFSRKDISGTIGILGPMRMDYGFNQEIIKQALEILFQ